MYGNSCVNHMARPMNFSRSLRDVRLVATSSFKYLRSLLSFSSGISITPDLKWNRHPIHEIVLESSHLRQLTGIFKTWHKTHNMAAESGMMSLSWKNKKSSTYKKAACENHRRWCMQRSSQPPRRDHQAAENTAPNVQTR